MRRLARLTALVALAGCTPKVEVGIPDDPIVINLNVEIRQEVRVRLEDDVKALMAREASAVSERGTEGSPIQRAKRRGEAGERFDGYVDAVGDPDPELARLLNEINARRSEGYERIAQAASTSVDAVRLIAGKERLESAAPGEWILEHGGDWQRKQAP